MAQTLTVKASTRSATDGGFAGSDSFSVTTTGNGSWEKKGAVGTSEETWTIDTLVGNAGYVVIRNFDATNYVQVGIATTVYFARLLAGQSAVFPIEPGTASFFVKANTASCVLQIKVYEA